MTEYFERVKAHLESFDEETQKLLAELKTIRHLKKGDLLLKQNEICRKSHIMVSGVARKFFILDHKEVTTEFLFENDIAASFKSYVYQQPSTEIIECITDITVEVIDHIAFEKAKRQNIKLMEYSILITELYATWLEDRIFDFHTRSATERYLNLLKKSPEYFNHIKLTHIASYLGISLETLSRIRAKI
ncbi:Crp/Fnr family transcriptional regulator [Elizabethkingia meningoseptica]|uniref:Crp/Fnr family transcriptional regulator n=1 Tax=Elizabethkingia meningoseptica TaxID=238 RepID=UPI0023B1EAD1|nr:Crp/Fnr family transcriptional regulator [Elizabethkingia meningoseptica]MDE5490960.1 Crp/Fnr family transcriptional regulator [Elizabethkingia meningoseptica]